MTAKTGVDTFGRIGVAMVTPFDRDGALDVAAGRRLAAHLVDNGVDSLILGGTTGESPTTSVEEKLELLKAVILQRGDSGGLNRLGNHESSVLADGQQLVDEFLVAR